MHLSGNGCFVGEVILVFEGDSCDILVLRVSSHKYNTSLRGGGRGSDGEVIPVFVGGDWCNLLGESGCSGCLMHERK